MSAINQVLSDQQVNVAGQYLQTNPHIGYVVVDVETDYSQPVLEALRTIPATIRARVLF